MSIQPTLFDLPEQSETEEYRDIEGFPGYRVGSFGTVWSRKGRGSKGRIGTDWRQLKTPTGNNGYPKVILCLDGKMYHFTVHSLILVTFVGPRSKNTEACHADGNRLNNSLYNLSWGTHAENYYDRIRHGTTCRGERNGVSKLTKAKVLEIREKYAPGKCTRQQLADAYGVSMSVIHRVVKRISWVHV